MNKEQIEKNITAHLKKVQDDMGKIQMEFTHKDILPVETICNLQVKYAKLQNAAYFLMQMKEALFPSQILMPKNENGMKVIN